MEHRIYLGFGLAFMCVHAYLVFALTALFDGLVRPVSTVTLLVAHFIDADTLSTAALKIVRAFTFTHCRETSNFHPNIITDFKEICLLANRQDVTHITTSVLENSLTFGTAVLITQVLAVKLAVALADARNTATIVTLELIGTTSCHS